MSAQAPEGILVMKEGLPQPDASCKTGFGPHNAVFGIGHGFWLFWSA
jgi:hypothetical protein